MTMQLIGGGFSTLQKIIREGKLMRTKAILVGVTLALASLGLIFLGCGGAKQAEPYVVGGIFSISGPASYLGEPERNSMEMVAEAINAKGASMGILEAGHL